MIALVIGGTVYAFFILTIWACCRAAARADGVLEPMPVKPVLIWVNEHKAEER